MYVCTCVMCEGVWYSLAQKVCTVFRSRLKLWSKATVTRTTHTHTHMHTYGHIPSFALLSPPAGVSSGRAGGGEGGRVRTGVGTEASPAIIWFFGESLILCGVFRAHTTQPATFSSFRSPTFGCEHVRVRQVGRVRSRKIGAIDIR